MPDPERFRDSTQIRLSWDVFEGVRDDVEADFTVTVVDEGCRARIIGSPVEIKRVSEFLTRHGISVD
jgi:hypothetical protein